MSQCSTSMKPFVWNKNEVMIRVKLQYMPQALIKKTSGCSLETQHSCVESGWQNVGSCEAVFVLKLHSCTLSAISLVKCFISPVTSSSLMATTGFAVESSTLRHKMDHNHIFFTKPWHINTCIWCQECFTHSSFVCNCWNGQALFGLSSVKGHVEPKWFVLGMVKSTLGNKAYTVLLWNSRHFDQDHWARECWISTPDPYSPYTSTQNTRTMDWTKFFFLATLFPLYAVLL